MKEAHNVFSTQYERYIMFGKKRQTGKQQAVAIATHGALVAFTYAAAAFGLGFGNWVREGVTDSVDDFNKARRAARSAKAEEAQKDELLEQAALKSLKAKHGEDKLEAMPKAAMEELIREAKKQIEAAGLELVEA